MSAKLPKSVLEAAVGNGTVRRFRDFALVTLDGEGAICVPNDTWLPAASWANTRAPSGNRVRDRMNLLQRLDVLVTRRGTAIISTIGSHVRLARLQALMKRDGIEVADWNFPAQSVLDEALNPPQRDEAPASPPAVEPVEGVAGTDAAALAPADPQA